MQKIGLTILFILVVFFVQAQCQANFSYMQNGPTVVFTDLSAMQSTNYSATWQWDFGDGNTSMQQNPTHTYSNGIYFACLTVIFFDSTIMNYCTSFYCDSLLISNGFPATWDCSPATGCYDPGTGNGQYTSFTACQSACGSVSWNCNPPNMPAGCHDPGTGNGQYTTLAACQAACASAPSWNCGSTGCYDPGTGNGQYNTMTLCQSNCSSTTSVYCDSITVTGSQSQMTFVLNNVNTLANWQTFAPDGITVLDQDSMSTTHTVFNNYNPITNLPYDTLITCIVYGNPMTICCVTWIWNVNSGNWMRTGNITSIGEINLNNKKLVKVIDVLGRETKSKNSPLFYIYNDGTVEKKVIID